jgi:hypothetical protein
MSDNRPPTGGGSPYEPGDNPTEHVPLPPVAPPASAYGDVHGGASLPPAPPGNGGGGPSDPGGKPGRKGSIGRAILLTLLGMLVLFGLGFGIGTLFRSDKSASGGGDSQPTAAACATVEVTPAAVAPAEVTVDVLNTGAAAGTATKTGARLEAAGFKVGAVGNDTTSDTTSGAIIRYGATGETAANTLRGWILGNVKMELVERADSKVTLLLQDGFGGVATESEAQAALAKPSPSLSGPGCPTPTPSAALTESPSPSETGSASESASASSSQ